MFCMGKEPTAENTSSIPYCTHEGVPKGTHAPHLQGCEDSYLQDLVSGYTNSSVGKIKQAIEMLGLPEKQERAAKKAIAEILWTNAHKAMEQMWYCTEEGSKFRPYLPEPASYAESHELEESLSGQNAD